MQKFLCMILAEHNIGQIHSSEGKKFIEKERKQNKRRADDRTQQHHHCLHPDTPQLFFSSYVTPDQIDQDRTKIYDQYQNKQSHSL